MSEPMTDERLAEIRLSAHGDDGREAMAYIDYLRVENERLRTAYYCPNHEALVFPGQFDNDPVWPACCTKPDWERHVHMPEVAS